MRKLCRLLAESEENLISRLLYYAKKHNYVMYTSTLHEAWRASVVGLTEMILATMKVSPEIPEMSVNHDFENDPVMPYATAEAVKHRRRGVNLEMFIGLFKYYRQSYLDIVADAGFDSDYLSWSQLFINRVFDRVEIGILSKWLETSEDSQISELQHSNRLLTNEKNRYLTIFESLPMPVIFLDSEGRVKNMNLSAVTLFNISSNPGAFYYSDISLKNLLGCFRQELDRFIAGTASELIFEKSINSKSEKRHFEFKFARMLDISDKFSGIIIMMNDISDRKKIEDSRIYMAKQQLLTKMTIELSVSEEQERRRISSDLHDNIGQALLLSKIKLGTLDSSLSSQESKEELKKIINLQDEIIQSVRSLSQQLSPPILYNVGLEAAIKWLGKQMEDHYGLEVFFFDDGKEKPLSEDMRAILFQVCRELLINVSKYAGCRSADVSISRRKGELHLGVNDSGAGFDIDAVMKSKSTNENGLGLFLIRERVKYLGGKTTIISSPGMGTSVTIAIPLRRAARKKSMQQKQG